MASWKKKWDNDTLKKKVGEIVGSDNKKTQISYLSSEYENLSHNEAIKKMEMMGFSPKERKALIEENSELSRVFGVVKDENKPLTKKEKRRLLKKEEMHKKFNIKSAREDISGDIKNKKKNPLDGIYNKKKGTAKDYGYANVEEEGHHEVTALGGAGRNANSVTSSNVSDSVVGNRGATGLTGGSGRGIAKGSRPVGL